MPAPLRIVFLPGLLCDAFTFAHQLRALRPFAVCAVADFSAEDSIEGMARRALDLLDGPVVVIGHSMGARAALEMVRIAPERVARLCLMDTGIHTLRPGEAEKRRELVELAHAQGMAALAARWLPPMVHEGRAGDPALMEGLTAMVLRATPAQHERQIRALVERPDPAPLLPRIACPTLVLVGRQDRWSPLEQHQDIAARIPGAELCVIEEAGHMAPVEQPEAVTAALLRWLGLDAAADRIPDTPLLDTARSRAGLRLNRMAMALSDPANREAFRADEAGFLARFRLTEEERAAVLARDWREMVRLGGNLFYLLKLSAITPMRMTEIGALQAGMEHGAFLRERLGKQ